MKRFKCLFLVLVFTMSFIMSGCNINDAIEMLDKDPQKVINKTEKRKDRLQEEDQKKDWTIMIYGSCDIEPQLEKALLQELLEMVNVGNANGKVHLLAQIDFRNAKYIKSKRYYIRKDEMIVRGEYPNMNMGDPNTLEDFLNWGLSYKAEKRMLFVLGHGTGWISVQGPGSITEGLRQVVSTRDVDFADINPNMLKTQKDFFPMNNNEKALSRDGSRSFAYDHTSEDSITLTEASRVFERVLKGDKIDVLAFRSCLMNQLETAYQFSRYFDYFVSTQTSQLGVAEGLMTSIMGVNNIGFDPKVLTAVRDSNSSISPREMARNMYQSIKNTNMKIITSLGSDFAFSAQCLDLRMIRRSVNSMKDLSYLLRRNMNSNNREAVARMINSSRESAVKFGGLFEGIYEEGTGDSDYEYMDLGMFLRNLSVYDDYKLNDVFLNNVRDISMDTRVVLSRACLDKFSTGFNFEGVDSGGVTSIFAFPAKSKMVKIYNKLMKDKYEELDFSRDTYWDEMLEELYKDVY